MKTFAARLPRLALACAVLLAWPAGPVSAAPRWEVPAEVSQGRVFLVRVTDSAPFSARLDWLGKSVPLTARANGNEWEATALLAAPLDARGRPELTLSGGGTTLSAGIAILSVPWKEERISVQERYASPPPEIQEQAAREAERNRRAIASFLPEKEWELPLLRPVSGGVSSAFGGRRVVNGEPRAPHRGTDMRGPTGTPVRAVAAGTVLLAEPQYFSGNVIFLDHGQGVVSSYAHLSAFDVRPGDRVERGAVVGRVGATGRVTGPHLHLGLFVLGTAVDAMPLFVLPLQCTGGPTREDPRPPAAPAPGAEPRQETP
jgi:murein DD-endopeptidase MepM/ murein hydrolase activator NlpD